MTSHYIDINFKYVENNSYKPNQGDLDANKERDRLEVLCDDYLFNRHRVNKKSINWLCKDRKQFKCSASLTIENETDKVLRYIKHQENHKELTKEQLADMNLIVIMKKNAHLSDEALEQIYLKELRNVVVDNDIPLADVDTVITSFEKIESCLRKRRGKTRPKLPKSLREVCISGDYLLTVKRERFEFFSKSNKIIVFCSLTGFEILSKSPQWHGDGTFNAAAKHYYQLYIIHA